MLADKIAHLFHLLGFAAFLGAAFAQQELMKSSARTGIEPAVRDAYERLAAALVTKIELPALFMQVATGVAFVVMTPGWLKMGWLHGKLTAVVLLLVLAHLEMFNARAVVRLRREGGEKASGEIEGRKRRHATMGVVGAGLVVAVLGLVFFGR